MLIRYQHCHNNLYIYFFEVQLPKLSINYLKKYKYMHNSGQDICNLFNSYTKNHLESMGIKSWNTILQKKRIEITNTQTKIINM